MRAVSRLYNGILRHTLRNPRHICASVNRAATMPLTMRRTSAITTRNLQSSARMRSIMPDSEDPPPKESESVDQPTVPTDIPTTEFHERADAYLNNLVERLEEAQEKDPSIEVEYSAGVLEVSAKENKYVLNKQPPNKQIWLSSPISGPKRYDWVVSQESMDHKEGSGSGDWIYLRDGSSLTALLRKELGVEVGVDDAAPQ